MQHNAFLRTLRESTKYLRNPCTASEQFWVSRLGLWINLITLCVQVLGPEGNQQLLKMVLMIFEQPVHYVRITGKVHMYVTGEVHH